MGLHGKLVAAIEFKHGGDVFHELFRMKPHEISTASPGKVKSCDLIEGEFGKVGSIISWNYIHDGKEQKAKEVIEEIDEEKKLIKFRVLEGDLMELYKEFINTVHVEKKAGVDIDLVTCVIEYEMVNEDVEHPISLLSHFIHVIKDIEAHHDNLPVPAKP